MNYSDKISPYLIMFYKNCQVYIFNYLQLLIVTMLIINNIIPTSGVTLENFLQYNPYIRLIEFEKIILVVPVQYNL